jgi:putative nucleotidyltransferase with HDIG domain
MPTPLPAKRVELILRQLEQLPTLPAVALRALQVTGDTDATVMEVVRIISSDQSLTARILHLVRRADLGVREEITSIERAIVMLGFEAVRSAVLCVTVFEAMESSRDRTAPALGAFSREEFWKHSIAVACAAELLAEVMGKDSGVSPSEAFVCGLLHDLGKVALDAILPKSFAKVVEATELLRSNIADIERSVIGLDHMVVGKRLAEHWELPTMICESIWLHGHLPQTLPASVKNARMVSLITLADLIAREQHLGYSGNHVLDGGKEELIVAVGLNPRAIDAKLVLLLERIERRASVLNLIVPPTPELYQEAMKRANEELGKVSTQLAMKNRRLQSRTRYFDALGAFQAELRPDGAPQAVLKTIGRTAQSLAGLSIVAVFSLPPEQDYAEVIVLNEAGNVIETALADCVHRPSPGACEGPVLPAGEDLEWLISSVGPRLSDEKRFWICLKSDNYCVGGIVWGAAIGEAQRLAAQAQELNALGGAWQLALRMSQIREESRHLSEQLAQSNRELQSAQGDLQRARLTRSVGEMAAGAAHEMNNPLAIISGRSQLLASQLTDSKMQALANTIQDQSQRLSQIITELMEYAKPSPPQIVTIDLESILAAALHEAKARGNMADRFIEMTMGELPPVAVDTKQAADALTEVIDNALSATDERIGHVEIHAAFDAISRRVAVTISDDGVGMDEFTLRRAFDPFFSSKPAGRRRGMGLAKAQRWIELSGGTIKLESRPGRGTRAVILLPVAGSESDAVEQPGVEQRKAL